MIPWRAERLARRLVYRGPSSSSDALPYQRVFERERAKGPHPPIEYTTVARAATYMAYCLGALNRPILDELIVGFDRLDRSRPLEAQRAAFATQHVVPTLLRTVEQRRPFATPAGQGATVIMVWKEALDEKDGGFTITLFYVFVFRLAERIFERCAVRFPQGRRELEESLRSINAVTHQGLTSKTIDTLRDEQQARTLEKIALDVRDFDFEEDLFRGNVLLRAFYAESHEATLLKDEPAEPAPIARAARGKKKSRKKAQTGAATAADSARDEEAEQEEAGRLQALEAQKRASLREDAARHIEAERRARELSGMERARETTLRRRILDRRAQERQILRPLGPVAHWMPGRQPWRPTKHAPFGGIPLLDEEQVPSEDVTTRHYVVKDGVTFVPSRDDRLCYLPYGSFEYSEVPGDLDVYCTRPLEERADAYRAIDPHMRILNNRTVWMRIGDVDVEIHHGVPAPLIEDALALHNAIVGHMERVPAVLDLYEGLKETCIRAGVYASKYGLFKGVGLSLLAISVFPTTKSFTDELVAFASSSASIQFALSADGTLRVTREAAPRACIRYGSSEVMALAPKCAVAVARALTGTPAETSLVLGVRYDAPGALFGRVRRTQAALEADARIRYAMPIRTEDGALAFASNDTDAVAELWRAARAPNEPPPIAS